MLPVSQILERNIALFNSERWLVVNPGEFAWLNLCSGSDIAVLHQYYDVFQSCTGYHTPLEFDSRDVVANPAKLNFSVTSGTQRHTFAPFITEGEFDNVLITMPKAKSQLVFLVEMAKAVLADDGVIYIVGENRSGIKSVGKVFAKQGSVTKVDSARHCTLLSFRQDNTDASFDPTRFISHETYELNSNEWSCCGFPGVFSEGELDEGTKLLLETLPIPIHGKTLDFACGAGVISAFLLTKLKHLTIDLSDVSAIALFAAAHTLHHNNSHGKLIAANGLKGITQQYQNIVTNPPFHTGIRTDYQIVTDFVQDAVESLTKGGKLFIVANRFLPYMQLLTEQFQQSSVMAQNSRFSVYFSS